MHPIGFRISYREVGLLALAQAMLMTGTSLLISTSALVGRNLSEDPALATIPLGLQFLALTLIAPERVTPNDERESAYRVRRLAATVGRWVIPGAQQREQATALHAATGISRQSGTMIPPS
jgi:Zn-dependent protease with chaperone function